MAEAIYVGARSCTPDQGQASSHFKSLKFFWSPFAWFLMHLKSVVGPCPSVHELGLYLPLDLDCCVAGHIGNTNTIKSMLHFKHLKWAQYLRLSHLHLQQAHEPRTCMIRIWMLRSVVILTAVECTKQNDWTVNTRLMRRRDKCAPPRRIQQYTSVCEFVQNIQQNVNQEMRPDFRRQF